MSADASSELWTTRKLLAWMGDAFKRKDLESPRLMSELLMAHVLGCDRLKLYTEADRPATPLERQTLRDMVGRALKHEPVQYLVGEAWFFGMPFKVDRRVLIPRPATEAIVQEVLTHVRAVHGPSNSKGEGVLIADVCTGSGCIATALLKNIPLARGVATDISADALDVAKGNATRHGVADRVEFLQGDLLAPLLEYPPSRADGSLDALVSNPPYIPDDEWPAVAPNVKDHEPHLALRGGVDGLDFVRTVIAAGPRLLKAGGIIAVEVADSRASAALALAKQHEMLADARIVKDHEELPRVIVARRA
jgi:release factor glutamine methyltransferase